MPRAPSPWLAPPGPCSAYCSSPVRLPPWPCRPGGSTVTVRCTVGWLALAGMHFTLAFGLGWIVCPHRLRLVKTPSGLLGAGSSSPLDLYSGGWPHRLPRCCPVWPHRLPLACLVEPHCLPLCMPCVAAPPLHRSPLSLFFPQPLRQPERADPQQGYIPGRAESGTGSPSKTAVLVRVAPSVVSSPSVHGIAAVHRLNIGETILRLWDTQGIP